MCPICWGEQSKCVKWAVLTLGALPIESLRNSFAAFLGAWVVLHIKKIKNLCFWPLWDRVYPVPITANGCSSASREQRWEVIKAAFFFVVRAMCRYDRLFRGAPLLRHCPWPDVGVQVWNLKVRRRRLNSLHKILQDCKCLISSATAEKREIPSSWEMGEAGRTLVFSYSHYLTSSTDSFSCVFPSFYLPSTGQVQALCSVIPFLSR